MKKALMLALAVSLTAAACTKKSQATAVELKTEDQKTLYALGLVMSENLATFSLSEADVEFVKAGFTDGALKRTRQVDLAVYGPKLRDLALALMLRRKRAETAEMELKGPDGIVRGTYFCTGVTVSGESRDIGILLVMRDVTTERNLDKVKEDFLHSIVHDLRTPITAIKGYTSLLLEGFYGKLAAKTKEPVERIFNSSQRLVKMVADFLDISKIEQGKMAYTFADADLGEIVRDVAAEFDFVAKEKGLSFDLEIPKKTRFPVLADEGKLRQVISNIIDNSIKYTPKGGITVSVERDGAGKATRVRIRDTGIGLSAPDKEHIFGKFSRGEGGQKENTHGSGLGLYVAKIMVEAQNGKLWVESEGVGKGSTFVIEFAVKEG